MYEQRFHLGLVGGVPDHATALVEKFDAMFLWLSYASGRGILAII
jgi:hypothetical protein